MLDEGCSGIGRDLANDFLFASLFAFEQRVNAVWIGSRDREIRKRGKRVPVVSPAAEIVGSLVFTCFVRDRHVRTLSLRSVIVALHLSRSVAFHPVRLGLARKLNK